MKNDHNIENQRQRLLEMLKQMPCTTFDIRHTLDIIAPAPRIFELRHEQGYNIQTFWDIGKNPGGGRHRIARYVLLPGRFEGEKENV